MKRRLYLFISIAVMISVISACGRDSEPSNEAPTGDAVEHAQGKLIYKNYCLSCHGTNLQGGRGVNLLKIGERADQEMIADKVRNGGGGMPSFKVSLKEEDIQAVAAWLATIKE